MIDWSIRGRCAVENDIRTSYLLKSSSSNTRLLFYSKSTFNLDSGPTPIHDNWVAVLKTDNSTVQLIVAYSGGSRVQIKRGPGIKEERWAQSFQMECGVWSTPILPITPTHQLCVRDQSRRLVLREILLPYHRYIRHFSGAVLARREASVLLHSRLITSYHACVHFYEKMTSMPIT